MSYLILSCHSFNHISLEKYQDYPCIKDSEQNYQSNISAHKFFENFIFTVTGEVPKIEFPYSATKYEDGFFLNLSLQNEEQKP